MSVLTFSFKVVNFITLIIIMTTSMLPTRNTQCNTLLKRYTFTQSRYFYDTYQNHSKEGCFRPIARTLCVRRMTIVICRNTPARTMKDINDKQFLTACSCIPFYKIKLSRKLCIFWLAYFYNGYHENCEQESEIK